MLSASDRPPVAPNRDGFNLASWKVLAAYLIEERRLIEFLLGPVVRKEPPKTGTLVYVHDNDICLDCFTPLNERWRFPKDDVREELDGRAGRINARLAHFSWILAGPDTRVEKGIWDTHYLDLILAGLGDFGAHLDKTGSQALADAFRQSMTPGNQTSSG